MRDRFPLHLFHELLLSWFRRQGRDLPWRKKIQDSKSLLRDPYRVLVSELMLQQTQVSRVIPKFQSFLRKWPSIEKLSSAPLSEVLIEWEGLGYNRRAKHMLETAKIIVSTHQGKFPDDAVLLRKLPGFGPYMVSALRVFAFGFQDSVIDVNVRRVLSRVETGNEEVLPNEVAEISTQSIPQGKSDDWHQALMDFGATVCTAKAPSCSICVLSRICSANKKAISFGFSTYADWLVTQPKKKVTSKKDIGKKFEETDRYFRGRIIDFLRSGTKPMEDVWQHIHHIHGLIDRKRFGRVIESLVTDGLIVVKGNTVLLAN